MKVVEDNSSFYAVRKTQYGVFIITILGIAFGFIIYPSNNLAGIISNLIGIGTIFLPFKEKVSVDKVNKKMIISWSSILGGRKRDYDIKNIKKFTLTSSGGGSWSFNSTIFSPQKGFIENISLFSNNTKKGFYLTGYMPKYSRRDIPDMPYFNKIAEICGKKVEYLDSSEAVKETITQVSSMIKKYQKDKEK